MNPDLQVTLSSEELRMLNAYWRAANYLAVGMIYLRMTVPALCSIRRWTFPPASLRASPCAVA
jgi:phosphoketolase